MDTETTALLDFIQRNILKSSRVQVDEDTPLVSSGLIDSFTLPQLLVQVERITNSRIAIGRVSPQDFETVRTMLEMARRVGVPKR